MEFQITVFELKAFLREVEGLINEVSIFVGHRQADLKM